MPTLSTISPLELFREIFPAHRLVSFDGELKYGFEDAWLGGIYEWVAQRVIIEKKLALTARLEKAGQITLVVKHVPEESIIAR